jgi:tetratricopeptide (TPR) repeat protein
MQEESILGNVTARAAEVSGLMTQLRGLLDASMDPDRMALRYLGVDRMGWTQQVYCEDAFKVWSDQLKREPGRFQTIHHLAIMYHARAIDREAEPDPAKSNSDWEMALGYWSTLCGNDDFWNYLAGIACKEAKRDPVDELRNRMPELLLQVHYDIALAEGTKRHRIEFHIGLVKKSSFSKEAKEAVQRNSYTRFISRVPDTVWQIDTLDPAVIVQGMDAITEFLSIDPGCVPALEDAVRLQVRLLRARNTELQAAGDDQTARNKMLRLMQQEAEKWRPYFEQLVSLAKNSSLAEKLDEEVRQKLALWYRIMGDVLRALDRSEESIGFYQSGASIALKDDEECVRCTQKSGEAMAYVAREKAHKAEPGAKEYCNRVRRERGLSVTAHWLLANAFTLLDDFDTAEALCKAGIAMEPDLTDLDALEEHEKDRERLSQMLREVGNARKRHDASQLIKAGQEHLKAERFNEAVAAFSSAQSQAPEEIAVHFYRAQAYAGLGNSAKALEDAREFSRKMPRDAPRDMRTAAENLEREIKEQAENIRKFGVQTPRLRREAAMAYKAEQFSVAESKLREALNACPSPGRHEVECELSIVLANWAVHEVNEAGVAPSLATLRTAEGRLQEALRLDSSNQHANNNLETVRRMKNSVSNPRFGGILGGGSSGDPMDDLVDSLTANMFQPPLRPDKEKCKQLLVRLIANNTRPEKIVSRFTEEVNKNLFTYVDFRL